MVTFPHKLTKIPRFLTPDRQEMISSKQNAAPFGPRMRPELPPKGVAQHSQATERGENAVQGCRPALTGNEKGRKRRPRVPPSTHRQRKGAKTSPKGVARHSQATKRGENVVQGCRPALTGDRKSRKRCPRVPPGTHRQRKGAKTSPKGVARHSQATERGINVAQGCHPALTGDRKSLKRCPRVLPSTHRQRKGAKTPSKGAARHSQATERGINIAQGRRAALLGNEQGRERRPKAQGGTLRRQI